MRLEPSEEMMYRRMDWKERLLLLFPLLGILASVGLLLIGSGRWRIWGVAVVGDSCWRYGSGLGGVSGDSEADYAACELFFGGSE